MRKSYILAAGALLCAAPLSLPGVRAGLGLPGSANAKARSATGMTLAQAQAEVLRVLGLRSPGPRPSGAYSLKQSKQAYRRLPPAPPPVVRPEGPVPPTPVDYPLPPVSLEGDLPYPQFRYASLDLPLLPGGQSGGGPLAYVCCGAVTVVGGGGGPPPVQPPPVTPPPVQPPAVPEPEGWALLLVGFFCVAAALRNRAPVPA